MDNTKTELLEKIKAANTALVTVSKNPSVDELAACIGMALLLSKLKKHATAVFSGEIPSTIEFLKPEETLEKTPDSLRDFIISLDRNKADKLRYKVEDKVVKIFITPYRTSINEDDLEFSQGEFNVDLVLTLGVENANDLDKAISSGGNVLHDATVISISNTPSNIGSINWSVPQASSLCELVADLSMSLGDKLLDAQISTALLTGIVAETERFSNDKTSSMTMSLSSQLMAAGANQKLVATQLSVGGEDALKNSKPPKSDDGELDINHGDGGLDVTQPIDSTTAPPVSDDTGTSSDLPISPPLQEPIMSATSLPDMSGQSPPVYDTNPSAASNLHDQPSIPTFPAPDTQETPAGFTPPPASWAPPVDNVTQPKIDENKPDPNATLIEIEKSVDSPHLKKTDEKPASPAVAPAPASNLKAQLNQLIPQISPDMAATSPTAAQAVQKSSKVESDINTNDLKPPSNPKAPPYPPPMVPPNH